ncbi:NAD(P)-binding protein [Biscogniauxia mediterranea]|nr:NAD(P)-binding protein [Biscogniauxia mediterranea]
MASTPAPGKSVLVTGANGYIGNAVCRAFRRAGWHVYGLVRRPSAACALAASEIIPVIGSVSSDLSWLGALLAETTFDAVASCTESLPFGAHYAHILALLTCVAEKNKQQGKTKPLVLFSSGCKDYGTTGLHGSSAGLAPHVETDPIHPPTILRDRAACALDSLAHADLFDAVVVRPTPVYGYGSSYYAVFFEVLASAAAAAAASNKTGDPKKVRIPADLDTIIHGCHVDDCGEAYVALATHTDRSAVAGQCFNVSGRRYETLGELLGALGSAYGISFSSLLGDVIVAGPLQEGEAKGDIHPGAVLTFGYSQWVGSDKIRRVTGWTDTRTLLSEDARAYRAAYEAAIEQEDAGVARTRERFSGILAGGATWEDQA